MSGEITVGVATAANAYSSIMWNVQLSYYFGDATSTQLINSGAAGSRTYGPRSGIFQTMVIRKASPVPGTDQHRTILAEIHDQVAGGGSTNDYYMRFASALELGDRLLFDGINYWTSAP
jgi:hypothetical protein